MSTEPTVVFVNSSGQESRFTIEYRREIDDRTISGIPYTAENIRADYHNVNPGALFYLSVSANIEYDPQKQISEFLGANLTTSFNNGFIPFLTIDSLGNISFGSTHDEVEIAGHTFQNVYTNWILPNDFTSFTKVYYTKDKGIVGYEGLDREMWAFDRFEN